MTQNGKKSGLLMKLIRGFLAVIVGFYLAICVTMAVRQHSLEYTPPVYDSAQVSQKAHSANLERWTNSDGIAIGFERRSPTRPVVGSVLITYGAGGTATGSAHYADEIQKAAAMDVYILEYPGYEDRPGWPTEKTIFAAATDALQTIPTNKPLYVVGESLGTGVASYLAGTYTNRIAGLVLLSPFTSVTDVGQGRYPLLPVSLLLMDKFQSTRYLHNYQGKVGITVDGRDDVVPEKFGLRLYNSYDGPKKLWQFPNGYHIQIDDPIAFWKEAIAFWKNN